MKNENFFKWLFKQKLDLLVAIISMMPMLSKVFVYHIPFELLVYITNLLFSILVIGVIIKHNIIIDDNKKNKSKLYQYAINEFGSRWVFLDNGQKSFFKRMNLSIKQFYYSLILVWTIWSILYVEKIICFLFQAKFISIYDSIFGDIMNLTNSIAIFFMYMVITIPTVKVTNFPSKYNKRMEMFVGMLILIFIGVCCILVDQYSAIIYNETVQTYARVLIGVIACISFMAFLGRLNSSFLNIPQPIIMCLYLYAALQLAYPVVDPNSIVFYLLAFIGKIFFYSVIIWILQKDRFLFFLINKAHAMSEADDMLKTFNRLYGKEMEKDDMI